MDNSLTREDYTEPCCPLKAPTAVTAIPIGRIIEKLDGYLNREDYSHAESLLGYWLAEAESGNDKRGKLTLLNEQIGLYRKLEKEEEGTRAIEEALLLTDELGFADTVSGATTFVNAATGYRAFGKAEMAFPLYEKAREIYEKYLSPDDGRLGGLYNNMALSAAALGNYSAASELYSKALEVMEKQEHGEAEMAITYLNLADLAAGMYDIETSEPIINGYLDRAEELLDCEALLRDGCYAFVCRKCAPVFGFYGRFLAERKYNGRADEINERT